jgi:hypothetical protein
MIFCFHTIMNEVDKYIGRLTEIVIQYLEIAKPFSSILSGGTNTKEFIILLELSININLTDAP